MKKLILSSSLALCFALNAYELDGKLDVKWTGYKTEKKAAVSGTFSSVDFNIASSESLEKFIKSAVVRIETPSFDSGNKFRDNNIVSTIFSLNSAKVIRASVFSVDTTTNRVVAKITMNEVTKDIPMVYEIVDKKIVAKGSIDILDFALKDSFLAFAKKCAAFHQNKSYSQVDISFTIPYK